MYPPKKCVALDGSRSAYDAIRTMSEQGVDAVPVVSDSNQIVGIFTERDYVRKVICRDLSPSKTPISDVMARDPVCAQPTDTLRECMRCLLQNRAHEVPVLAETGARGRQLGGLVTSHLIATVLHNLHTKHGLPFEENVTVGNLLSSGDVRKTSAPGPFNRVHVVRHTQSVRDALDLMDKHNSGAVVVEENGNAVGIFTESEFCRKVALSDQPPESIVIDSVLRRSPPGFVADRSSSISDCLTYIATQKRRHIPIFLQGRCEGIVSIRDLLNALYF